MHNKATSVSTNDIGLGHDLQNLTTIANLAPEAIDRLLNHALSFAAIGKHKSPYPQTLKGRAIIAFFAENSTRTRLSFEMAVKRLGGDFLLLTAEGSALKKGESDLDTLKTLNALHPDALIVRHAQNHFSERATQHMNCPVLNAGDGTNEHPTQALLDALTLREHFGNLTGLRVTICGDIKHSRVARSNVMLLNKLGADVTCVAPKHMSSDIQGATHSTDFEASIQEADVIMMLRIQRERLNQDINTEDYITDYQLNTTRLALAPPHCMVMHPGPMNRTVEVSNAVADNENRSLIARQVENGVYTRMACLDILLNSPSF